MNAFRSVLKTLIFLIPLLVSAVPALAYGAEPNEDALGRPKTMETRGEKGTCMAEVTYEGGIPRIHVVAFMREGIRHLGLLQVNDATYDTITTEYLEWAFHKAIDEYCLPLIIPGAAST